MMKRPNTEFLRIFFCGVARLIASIPATLVNVLTYFEQFQSHGEMILEKKRKLKDIIWQIAMIVKAILGTWEGFFAECIAVEQ